LFGRVTNAGGFHVFGGVGGVVELDVRYELMDHVLDLSRLVLDSGRCEIPRGRDGVIKLDVVRVILNHILDLLGTVL
jgi:hypothetical protein